MSPESYEKSKEYKRLRYTNPETKEKIRQYQKEYNQRPAAIERAKKRREETKLQRNARTHIHNIKKKYPNSFSGDGSEQWELLELWLDATKNHSCKYCGDKVSHVDHKHPLSKGGLHTWSNLQRLCKICNVAKHNLSEEEFMNWICRIMKNKGEGV